MEYTTSMLVGYTGFVGSNIAKKHEFTYKINSKNKEEAYGKKPDLLIYAGLRAEKFLANNEPEKDRLNIEEAFAQIKRIEPKQLVLISTVDVYKTPVNVDENTTIVEEGLAPYGKNRYRLEELVREKYPDALIIRLPGLFGENLKKNFIYDYIHKVPGMLKAEKYEELAALEESIADSYEEQDNGFYKCSNMTKELEEAFKRVGFSALNFTDSRGIFQFYNLERLWDDICIALDDDVRLLNVATEPVSVSEIYKALSGEDFVNEVANVPPYYNYRTIHAPLFGGQNGYFESKEEVLRQIKEFVLK